MAFGSWLKGIFGKAKDFITKFAPVVKSVLGVVAPVLGQLGGVLGGTAGSVLSKIGTGVATANRFGTKFLNPDGAFTDQVLSFGRSPRGSSIMLDNTSSGLSSIPGAHGGGIRRITPRLK